MPRARARAYPGDPQLDNRALRAPQLNNSYFTHHPDYCPYALHSIIFLSILAISLTAYALPVTNGSNGLKIQSSASRSASTDAQHRQSDDPQGQSSFFDIQTILLLGPIVLTAISREDNYVLDILLSKDDNNYIGTGFSKKQWESLKELVDRYWHPQRSPAPPSAPLAAPLAAQLAQPAPAAPPPTAPPAAPLAAPSSAPPPAHKPCTQASPELPPQPTPAPVPAPVPTRSYPPSPSVEDEDEVEEKQVYKIPLWNVKQIRQKFGAVKKMPRIRVSKFFENCIGLPTKFGAIYMCFSRDEDLDVWYTTMLNHKQKLY